MQAERCEMVGYLMHINDFSQGRACMLAQMHCSSARHRPRRIEPVKLRAQLRELAAQRSRFRCRRLHILLRREYGLLNHKRVYRRYSACYVTYAANAAKSMAAQVQG